MSIRRSLIGLVAAVAVALSACSSTTSSGVPSVAIPSVELPSIALPSLAVPSASGLEGFCADFASKVAAKWPNIDASTATAIAPLFTQWAAKAEMAAVRADVATIGVWLTATAAAGTVASPPPAVATAFDHLKAFADSSC
jgi:hypothetical protein